jgi:exodeoxyribonuclease VII small subunit
MAKDTSVDYAALSTELDTILDHLESPDIDIDEAMKQYERGMDILKQLEAHLKTAENKVEKIQADFGQTEL